MNFDKNSTFLTFVIVFEVKIECFDNLKKILILSGVHILSDIGNNTQSDNNSLNKVKKIL